MICVDALYIYIYTCMCDMKSLEQFFLVFNNENMYYRNWHADNQPNEKPNN